MDVNLALENRGNGYIKIVDFTPLEQQELLRLQAERDKGKAYYKSAPTVNRGIRFGEPSMGDQSAGLRNWDHRAMRPDTQSNTVGWGIGPSFSNLRIAEQNSPPRRTNTGHNAQSPCPPGMEVDPDRVDFRMGQLQLDDLYSPNSIHRHSQANDPIQSANHAFAKFRISDHRNSTANRVRRQSQAYPPGMNNLVQSANSAFASLRINDQRPSNANGTNTANNGNPFLPGMGYRHTLSSWTRGHMKARRWAGVDVRHQVQGG
jgi:hypothetical protein